MKKLKMHLENNKILYRMIAGFFLVSMIAILLVTTIAYMIFSREIKNEIYRSQEQSLQQISNTVSFRAEYANFLMLQIQRNKQASKLFYSSDMDVVAAAMEPIGEMRVAVKQLHSVYIYNEYDNKIFYSGENTFPAINDKDSFADQGFLEILNNIEAYSKRSPILRKLSVEMPNGKEYETYVYTYLLYDAYSTGSVKNITAFNFHLGWMEEALDFITAGHATSEKIWIVDKNRQLVYTNTGEMIGTIFDNEVLPDEIFENESGYLITGTGKERQMLVYANPARAGYEGWTFVSFNDYAALMEPLEQVRRICYMICGIGVILSLLAIGGFSRAIYEPVRFVIDRVKVLEEEQKKKNKTDQMLFLRRLFLGNIADDINVIENNLKKHHIECDPDADIRMILISIDYLSSYVRNHGNHPEESEEVIEGYIRECFEKRYDNPLTVRMQNGLWAVCIPEKEEGINPIILFEELNTILKEKLDVTISMAVSNAGHSVRDIQYLYSEAVDIHSYHYLFGQNRLITAEDIKKNGQCKFEYPGKLEKKLLSNLFGGKYEETADAFEEFVEEVRWYTVDEIKLSFILLAYAIKNASVKSMTEPSSILLEFDKFYMKLQTVESIDQAHQMFKNLFREITDKMLVHSKERHEILIEQIKDYVKQNYGNMNLSMNQLSDHVNMSAAYLGRLFKQVTGITFTEYLTKYRLDKACSLLKDTDKTINEISDEIGFTNSSYFYIIFKKYLDCTPNQYRKQCGNLVGEEET